MDVPTLAAFAEALSDAMQFYFFSQLAVSEY